MLRVLTTGRIPGCAALVAGAIVFAVAPASAATLGPGRLFPPASPFTLGPAAPDVAAVNERGDAIVGEMSFPFHHRLWIRQRFGPRGAWSGPIPLTPPSLQETNDQFTLASINGQGAAVAVFTRRDRTYVARRDRRGHWRAPVAFGRLIIRAATISNSGLARLVEVRRGHCETPSLLCPWSVIVLDQPAIGARWAESGARLEIPRTAGPNVRVSRRGDVLAAWSDGDRGEGNVVLTRRLLDATSFEPPLVVGGPAVRNVRTAIADTGRAIVAWTEPLAPGGASTRLDEARIRVAVHDPQGWTAPTTLAATPEPGRVALGPASVDADGSAAVAWAALPAGPVIARDNTFAVSSRAAGATSWVESPNLLPADLPALPDLLDARLRYANERILVLWELTRNPDDLSVKYLSSRDVGGTWVSTGSVTRYELPAYAFATASDGRALYVEQGLWVRNFDDLPTPGPPRIRNARVSRDGPRATLTLNLGVAARLHIRRVGPGAGGDGISIDTRPQPAGVRRIPLGFLASGTHRVDIAACNRSLGCTVRSLVIRVH